MSVDFNRWALVGTNDSTGVGRMAQDMKAVLPLGRHLVAPSTKSDNRPAHVTQDVAFSSEFSEAEVAARLEGLDGLILLERYHWHPSLLKVARKLGVKTVCVPMWEWFRGLDRTWENCDFFACPNQMSLAVLQRYGFTSHSALVPWTLDLTRFPGRRVRGPAREFVHNAGLIDADDRKGTYTTETAFRRTKDSRLTLTIRSQNASQFADQESDARIKIWTGNFANPAELYAAGDCFIQPSKLEGLGFMVLEAVASGLPVITTDYAPMNEYVRQPELRATVRPFAYPAYSSAWIEHSHLRLPSIDALAKRITWAAEHDLEEISQQNRRWAEDTFAPARLLAGWEETLAAALAQPKRSYVEAGLQPEAPCHRVGAKIRRRIASATGVTLPFFSSPL